MALAVFSCLLAISPRTTRTPIPNHSTLPPPTMRLRPDLPCMLHLLVNRVPSFTHSNQTQKETAYLGRILTSCVARCFRLLLRATVKLLSIRCLYLFYQSTATLS